MIHPTKMEIANHRSRKRFEQLLSSSSEYVEANDRDFAWQKIRDHLLGTGQWYILMERLIDAFCTETCIRFAYSAKTMHHFNDVHLVSFRDIAPHLRGITVNINQLPKRDQIRV